MMMPEHVYEKQKMQILGIENLVNSPASVIVRQLVRPEGGGIKQVPGHVNPLPPPRALWPHLQSHFQEPRWLPRAEYVHKGCDLFLTTFKVTTEAH